ncbi:MAG: helix-turn-helix domain-containing protein [Gemmatimonadetes bacterium]|nr:helix-turn-helix domain-containing protein [Gemmatimonadota bacterium]MBK8648533.1 helix-turn-helix domain-containing protein [Gemmatimonadota bacterium]
MSTHSAGDTDDIWISQAEAARLRGVSRQAVARLVARGRLTVRRIGGRDLVRRDEVTSYKPLPAGRRTRKEP